MNRPLVCCVCFGIGLLNTGKGGGQWEATSRTVLLPHESEAEKSLLGE